MEGNFMSLKNQYLLGIYDSVAKKDSTEPEFLQAVEEVLSSLKPVVEKREEEYRKAALLESCKD